MRDRPVLRGACIHITDMPIQLVETTVWIAGNRAAPKLSSLKASTSLLFRGSDTTRSWMRADWKFISQVNGEFHIIRIMWRCIKNVLETYNYIVLTGKKFRLFSTFVINYFRARKCWKAFGSILAILGWNVQNTFACSRHFSRKVNRIRGVIPGISPGMPEKGLCFLRVCTRKGKGFALLVTFLYCLDWVLRGDGNRGRALRRG